MRTIADGPRAVRWSELATREVASARDFYAGVCGRSYGGAPMDRGGVCTLARVGGRIVAGIIDMALVPEVADMDRAGGVPCGR